MTELKQKKCVPCEGGVKPFGKDEIESHLKMISSGWQVIDSKRLKKEIPVKDFNESMEIAGKIAVIAEEEQHHPDLVIHYSSIEIEFTTHAIDGLSENDFIMAAKVDDI